MAIKRVFSGVDVGAAGARFSLHNWRSYTRRYADARWRAQVAA
jgi:hypothetical protein